MLARNSQRSLLLQRCFNHTTTTRTAINAAKETASKTAWKSFSTVACTTDLLFQRKVFTNAEIKTSPLDLSSTDRRWKSTSGFASNITSSSSSSFTQQQQAFPSLIISAKEPFLQASGEFAESQALYLNPDTTAVDEIVQLLRETNTGIVAHYYMDVELQGVLQAVQQQLPGRVGVADSLKMGDLAVQMVHDKTDPCENIVCLGVDFMSESVQALVQSSLLKNTNGKVDNIPVYRADSRAIGCSLAEAAERESYQAWLTKQSENVNALHVVYINTSLETKAVSNTIVPTITCTSSNVLPTILQASAQMGPNDLKILYGPDTYMGENLVTYLDTILSSGWDDARIQRELHPRHSRESLQQLRDSLCVFPQGNCIVHHMFGASVVDLVQNQYDDCFVTAHLEVPGEMFKIAMEKSLNDQGVVGSTSNILHFIQRKVQEAATNSSSNSKQQQQQRLRFILGTEAGMVTSIVSSVKEILKKAGNDRVEAEIIFPVATDAYTATDSSENGNNTGLSLVPGVQATEGCSTVGGCATCPFMKMNSLDSLTDLLEMIKIAHGSGNDSDNATRIAQKLRTYLPPDRLQNRILNGRPAIEAGSEPIMYMREFMKTGELPFELCQRVTKSRFNRGLLYRA